MAGPVVLPVQDHSNSWWLKLSPILPPAVISVLSALGLILQLSRWSLQRLFITWGHAEIPSATSGSWDVLFWVWQHKLVKKWKGITGSINWKDTNWEYLQIQLDSLFNNITKHLISLFLCYVICIKSSNLSFPGSKVIEAVLDFIFLHRTIQGYRGVLLP